MGTVLDILRGKVDGSQLGGLAAKRVSVSQSTGSGSSATWGVGGQLMLDPEASAFSASATAYRCVMTTASNLASVDLAVATDGTDPDPEHDIALLWNRRPNPAWSARAQKEVAFARLELTGEQLFYVNRGDTGVGEASELWPIFDPVEVVVGGRRDGQLGAAQAELMGYVVKARGGKRVPLLPSEVLWLRYPHPFDPWAAMAPWKAALYAVESDAYARAWQRGEFQHGARPSSVVYLGDLEREAHDIAVAEFRGKVEGADNAGKSLLVSGPTQAKVEHLTLSPAEMSYLESRAANSAEVALAFGYRVDDLLGGSTYENQRAAKTARWSDLLVPKLEVLASETDRQLLPDLRLTAVFDVSHVEALRENEDAVYNRLRGIAYTDVLLLDEMREQLGYDPLPGGIGQQTLTSYRKALDVDAQLKLNQLMGEPVGRAQVRVLVGARGLRRVRACTPTLANVGQRALQTIRGEVLAIEERAKRKPRNPVKFYDRHERIGQRAVRKLADKQERVVLAALRKLMRSHVDGQPPLWSAPEATIGRSTWTELPVTTWDGVEGRIAADDIFDVPYWRERTVEQLDAYISGVWDGGAEAVAAELGISLDLFDQRVLKAMDNRAAVLAAQVTETTRRVLDGQLLQAGVEGGESIDQLAARITAVFDDLRGYRAEAIARTETVGGYNAASRIGAVASGVVTGRTWLNTTDDRTRESHTADGVGGEHVNGMDARYSNGLLHPGDPTGDPSETVNCRCTELYDVDDDANA